MLLLIYSMGNEDKKQISMWVDKDVLKRFDIWCLENDVDRTEEISNFMKSKVEQEK